MSYEDLLSIYREAEAELSSRKAVDPQSCPVDGTPLAPSPDGSLVCRFDGVSWPRDRALFESANHP